MKYLIALLLGMAVGSAAALYLLVKNPVVGQEGLSPLASGTETVMHLEYSGNTQQSIAFTNDGESPAKPYPAKILQLWEDSIRKTRVHITSLRDVRGDAVGFGIKYSSDSEATHVLGGKAMADSVWHIVLPGQGTLFVEQSENYWNYLRDVVFPAYTSGGRSWKGTWSGHTTAGPGSMGVARVVGGAGQFSGISAEAVESHIAKAYSADMGPVALSSTLLIDLPSEAVVAESVED